MSPRRTILLVALVLALFAASAQGQNKTKDFPLTPGTYWVYQGFVRSSVVGSETGETKTTHVTWKTSVTRAIHVGGLTLAVIKGMPGDLDWSEGDATPSLSVVIRTLDAKFYLIEGDEAKSLLAELDHPQYSWQQVPIDEDWFLQLPLTEGKKFCGANGMRRTDDEYCWVTGPPHAALLANVKGVPSGKHIAYPVEYFTSPEEDEFDFVPGIGMVTYEYHHHGTTADTELHLIEFHDGDAKP
ncbi:MAG: hypothetical protein WAN23_14025 [Candidatus Acidiferrales bacterium]